MDTLYIDNGKQQWYPPRATTTVPTPQQPVQWVVSSHQRCECHDCTQARWKMSNPLVSALNNG